ncbi:MAG: nucleotide sugar dehydrogenase [Akkermansiaceae bacterium]
MKKIAIVGLGYVGLPLSLQFAKNGFTVVGLDIDADKVQLLRNGRSGIRHIPSEEVAKAVQDGLLEPATNFARVGDVEAVIICVPTPLNKHREPDLSYVLDTGKSIAPHLRPGVLVVLESTTYPGTTEKELREVLENGSGLVAGKDFHLAFSPEREDPGNPDSKVAKIPKVVGGHTPACLDKAVALYGRIVEKIVPVSSCAAAEATKLTENIFRSVNIALVNELKMIYEKMGIDIWEIIAAAKTKPFGFMAFYPGPGLGGHCIPIDPFYLTWKAREFGMHTRFIELAGEVNASMPDYVIAKVVEALNREGKAVRGSKILLLGLAYKADVDDIRESPGLVLMERLEAQGAKVDYNDPYVPMIPVTREHAALLGRESRPVSGDYDCLVVATAHSNYDGPSIAALGVPVVDSRGIVPPAPHVFRA